MSSLQYLTETEIAGLAALAMRRAGSEWEWSFTGGNEIASGYQAGLSPSELAERMIGFAESRGFADYMVPGFEHGIGLMGDEWRIGMNDGPFPYWTNPDHRYRENELLICAMQYACPEEGIGFRYENPIVIHAGGCEPLSKFPLGVDIIA